MHRLNMRRWPWYTAACLLPLAWSLVEHAVQRPTPARVAQPCPSEVALGRTLGLMSTPVPKVPFPNWKTPPCADPEIEHNGACWVLPARADGKLPTPPCPASLWEWQGRCWKPVGKDIRPPTSLGR